MATAGILPWQMYLFPPITWPRLLCLSIHREDHLHGGWTPIDLSNPVPSRQPVTPDLARLSCWANVQRALECTPYINVLVVCSRYATLGRQFPAYLWSWSRWLLYNTYTYCKFSALLDVCRWRYGWAIIANSYIKYGWVGITSLTVSQPIYRRRPLLPKLEVSNRVLWRRGGRGHLGQSRKSRLSCIDCILCSKDCCRPKWRDSAVATRGVYQGCEFCYINCICIDGYSWRWI